MQKYLFFLVFCTLCIITIEVNAQDVNKFISIDLTDRGKCFEGIGALSAGASSRLLIDYPPEQRNEILDFLFKPKFGASLHHLKTEIGGDVNSTSGTEPSHARTREEYFNPSFDKFNRGYEWWLMNEAKKRNSSIYLDCLEWGAPGWIGNGSFYSTDNINYIISYIEGAQKCHDLRIDYIGIWNERMHDIEYIKNLKKALIDNELGYVNLVASDQTTRSKWTIANEMVQDISLMDAVDVIGDHYIERGSSKYESTANAQKTGKPLWNSEGGPWKGNWEGFAELVKIYNRGYVIGGLTKTISWSLITSYYENLALPNSGLMKANTPWSGYYEVEPALWAAAHTTQFATPGWYYISGKGCGLLCDSTISYVTLVSPDSIKDFSIILEAIDLKSPTTVSFKLINNIKIEKLNLWRSIKNEESFVQMPALVAKDGEWSLPILPGAVYSITTTQGQQKGTKVAPASHPFPFPFTEDFESTPIGRSPRYFSDQGGAFEVLKGTDGKNKVLRQVITRPAIEWEGPVINQTVFGDEQWTDYKVSADIFFNDQFSTASISGRLTETYRSHKRPDAYTLELKTSGMWSLNAGTNNLANGMVKIKREMPTSLKLEMKGTSIKAYINGEEIISLNDTKFSKGMVGFGSDFSKVDFDNVLVGK